MNKTIWLMAFVLASSLAFSQCQNANPSCSGQITAAAATCTAGVCVSIPLNPDIGAVGVTVSGTYVATLQFEGSLDYGTTWVNVSATPVPTSTVVTSTTGTGSWQLSTGGLTNIRVRGSAYTSGTATVVFSTSKASAKGSSGSGGSGTVTSVATTAPLSGGTITGTGTLACTTCATSSAGGRYAITFQFASAVISPASATTYYVGQTVSPQTGTTTAIQLTAPVACTISGGSYSTLVTGTKDTAANNITLKVYNLTTTTAYTDTAGTLTEQTSNQHSTTFTGANDSVSAGDNLLIQLVTPTFTTPPVSVYFQATVLCQP